MDKRWQLVLDCLNCETPPLGKPTLIRFRNRLIKKELDQGLIDRTVEIPKQKGGFGSSQLKAALDSSPGELVKSKIHIISWVMLCVKQ